MVSTQSSTWPRSWRCASSSGELVAADARDEIVVADRRAHALADRHQQRVARHVAERVVDRLELVEVDEQHRVHAVGVRARVLERRREPLLEERAVRQAGQRVVGRLVAQPRLVGLEQPAALDLGAVRLRVREREAHEVDEELQAAQRLAARDLAVGRAVGAEVADHLALGVAQHHAQRVALVPRVGRDAGRVAVGLAGEDRLLPVEFALRRDVVRVLEHLVVRREHGEDVGFGDALVLALAHGGSSYPSITRRVISPVWLPSASTIVTYLKPNRSDDPARDRLQGEVKLAEA